MVNDDDLSAFLAELDEPSGTVERFDVPDRMSMDEQRPWLVWLEHHHINPAVVALGGWIERDETRRQVRFWGMELLEPSYGQSFRYRVTEDCKDVDRAVRVMQLESVPSRFPV